MEEAASLYGLPRALLDRFPHKLSGGQRARVGLARAIGPRLDLLVLDEPTAAMDVSVQVTILQSLVSLWETLGISYVCVSHDRNVVVPRLDGVRAAALRLAGDPKSPIDPDPDACRFHDRCPVGMDRCEVEMPKLRRYPGMREAACQYVAACEACRVSANSAGPMFQMPLGWPPR